MDHCVELLDIEDELIVAVSTSGASIITPS
jgi:hypothetical protein